MSTRAFQFLSSPMLVVLVVFCLGCSQKIETTYSASADAMASREETGPASSQTVVLETECIDDENVTKLDSDHESPVGQVATKDLVEKSLDEIAVQVEPTPLGSILSEDGAALWTKAQASMTSGDFPTAMEHLHLLISESPRFADGLQARAKCQYRLGNGEAAIEDIEKALLVNSQSPAILADKAILLISSEDYVKAIETAERALALGEDFKFGQAILDWARVRQIGKEVKEEFFKLDFQAYLKLVSPVIEQAQTSGLVADEDPNVQWAIGETKWAHVETILANYSSNVAATNIAMPLLTETLKHFEAASSSDEFQVEANTSLFLIGCGGGIDLEAGQRGLERLMRSYPSRGKALLQDLVAQCWTTDRLSDPQVRFFFEQLFVKFGGDCVGAIQEARETVNKLYSQSRYASNRMAASGFKNEQLQQDILRYSRVVNFYDAILSEIKTTE
jgi:tetratricopeptide (TPR) repeat protein